MSKHFKPKTRGYYEIWVDGERAVSAVPAADTGQPAATPAEEPLYGEVYLPRKFKIVDLGDWCHTVGVDVLPVELGTEQWVRARRGRAGS